VKVREPETRVECCSLLELVFDESEDQLRRDRAE